MATAVALFIIYQTAISESSSEKRPVYVGVAFQGNTTAEAKLLIDRVRNYTNLFILGQTPVSRNETTTNEV